MNDLILKSKLIKPDLPPYFLLTKRIERLHRGIDFCRAVTVCAPAGYGKTTLISSYCANRANLPLRVCWYRLEASDTEPTVFTGHLLAALFSGRPDLTAKHLKTVQSKSVSPDFQLVGASICRACWDLDQHSAAARTFIVLDDFQNVMHSFEIYALVRYFLENLPPLFSLCLLSRVDTEIFTEKQKLENNILELRTADLVFGQAEIKELLQLFRQGSSSEVLSRNISKKTEGWIAGIMLLCQNLKEKQGDTNPEKGKLADEVSLFRYISSELFDQIDENLQDTLSRLAILSDFSEESAGQLYQSANLQDLINECVELGLFIQRIPGHPPRYRFHALFRKFLLRILEARCPPEEIEKLHFNAARYYLEKNIYSRAAEHIAGCNNFAKTADLVTGVGIRFMMVGESGQLRNWLDMLPEKIILSNPVLLIFKGLLMPHLKSREAENLLFRALQMARDKDDPVLMFRAATSLVFIYFYTNNMPAMVRLIETIPQRNRAAMGPPGGAPLLLEIMLSIGTGSFAAGLETAAEVDYSSLIAEDQWLCRAYCCVLAFCLGSLEDAEKYILSTLQLSCVREIEPAKATALYLLGTVLILKSDKDNLLPHLAELTAIGTKYGFDYHLAGSKRLAAFERYLSFDLLSALALLDEAVSLYQGFGNRAMALSTRLLRTLWALEPGTKEWTCLDQAKLDAEAIEKMKPGLMLSEIARSLLGAIARETGHPGLAETCLLSSIRSAQKKGAKQVLCGACFHLAKLYFTKGDSDQGRLILNQAMDLAAGNRYFMFWDIHLPTLLQMLLLGLQYCSAGGFASEALENYFGRGAAFYLREKIKNLDHRAVISFADAFISAHRREPGKKYYLVRAALFGKPEITVNGVKIADSEWKTRKNKGLLEYLLLNSGETVSRETLINIFWPQADRESAQVSLRTALYGLRKTLDRYNVELAGDSAFILENPEGLQINKNAALEVDIDHFLEYHRQYCAGMKQGDALETASREALENIISLYRGELMESRDYGDLLFFEREKCKSIFEKACVDLSAIYLRQKEPDRAEEVLIRAFRAEPYSESVCLKLLQLYMARGMRNKAAKLYNTFKVRVKDELDLEVDPRLAAAAGLKRKVNQANGVVKNPGRPLNQ